MGSGGRGVGAESGGNVPPGGLGGIGVGAGVGPSSLLVDASSEQSLQTHKKLELHGRPTDKDPLLTNANPFAGSNPQPLGPRPEGYSLTKAVTASPSKLKAPEHSLMSTTGTS